ncbi:aldo/keto reductase [Corynebacterium halotolerans]|uniref:aldo/keto reductase n=1 Tax=Corynebacterium halotolerans TaxID=225326 RepID=UPI003CF45400
MLGVSGLRVSEIGLGTSTWGAGTSAADAGEILAAFMAQGGSLIDSSPVYGSGVSEKILADLLDGTVPRAELVISSAGGVDPHSPLGSRVDSSRRRLLAQLDATLAALGTDHLDLWSVGHWDDRTPPEEVADTLDYAVRTGRVRYAGVRGYAGWQLAVTTAAASHRIVAAQNEYSLLVRRVEEELVPAARHLGIGMIAAAPLAQGILTGKYRSGIPAQSRATTPERDAEVRGYLSSHTQTIVEALHTAADGLGISPGVAALAWVRDRPGVSSAVVGARHPGQLRELLDAAGRTLPRAINKALDDVSR